MTYLYVFWIALLVFVVIGTVFSTFLYVRYRNSNRAQGNRLNTLDSMLFQH
jgi:hypothetical protein